MNIALSAQQLCFFRREGSIRFEGITVDRSNFLRKVGPIVLELTGKKILRLVYEKACTTAPSVKRMQDLFSLQGLIAVCVLTQDAVAVYEPSSLTSQISIPSHLFVFGLQETRVVENPLAPAHLATLKKMGYGYGSVLSNDSYPLIFK